MLLEVVEVFGPPGVYYPEAPTCLYRGDIGIIGFIWGL